MRFLIPAALLLLPIVLHAQPVTAPHIEVELVSAADVIVPGEPFMVGLRMTMEDEWHTYWRNPGDAGLPTAIEWELPEGFTAGEIQWPLPEAFGDPPEVSYGYEGEILLPVQITPPDGLQDGQEITLEAEASWLVCREACIPGSARLSIKLPVKSAAEPTAWNQHFYRAYQTLPAVAGELSRPAFVFTLQQADSTYTLTVDHAPGTSRAMPDTVEFFPYEQGIIDHSASQKAVKEGGRLLLRLTVSPYSDETPERIIGLLYAPDGWSADGEVKSLEVDLEVQKAR